MFFLLLTSEHVFVYNGNMNEQTFTEGNSEGVTEMKKNTRHKKYRVKSKFRFITSLVIVFGLLIGTGSLLFGNNVSIALTTDQTQTVHIQTGDTLWSIAKKYKSDQTDVRKAVYEICQANDISADELQGGMTIVIPSDL